MYFTRYVNIYRQSYLLLKLWGGRIHCMMCRITENVVYTWDAKNGIVVSYCSLVAKSEMSSAGTLEQRRQILQEASNLNPFGDQPNFFFWMFLWKFSRRLLSRWKSDMKIIFHYLEGNQDICVLDFCFLMVHYYSMSLVHSSFTIFAMRASEKIFLNLLIFDSALQQDNKFLWNNFACDI